MNKLPSFHLKGQFAVACYRAYAVIANTFSAFSANSAKRSNAKCHSERSEESKTDCFVPFASLWASAHSLLAMTKRLSVYAKLPHNKLWGSSLLIILLSVGCSNVDIGSVSRVVQKTFEASRPLSDEEEYYVGRSVAARILSSYSLLENKKLTEYVNLVGKTVALSSDRPITYGGYHFAILNSKEINAFACPGGTILITKGMINSVESEDELAAVLAHEVAHVNHRDGVSAIQKARLTEVATLIGTEAAQGYSPAQLSQIISVFEGSINDVFKTLVVNGYGKSQEYNADEDAISYLTRAGYNPSALKDFLQRLVSQGSASGGGIMKTHPATADRVEKVEKNLPKEEADTSLVQLRARRFEKALNK